MDLVKLKAQLTHHEGIKLQVYNDSVGIPTIGVGRNLRDKGITASEAMLLLENDISDVIDGLMKTYPWFAGLGDVRQRALIDMTFNVGLGGLKKSPKMLDALSKGQWKVASDEALSGPWVTKVGQRAKDIALQFLTGTD